MKFETVTGPAYWASYLVNGDTSGITGQEQRQADAWRERNGVVNVVSADDEARFTRYYGIYDPLADCEGGDIIDYTCERKET